MAAVANDIHSKNNDWSVEKVFAETATATRKMLGMGKVAQSKVNTKNRKPAFVKKQSSRVKEPVVTGLQKELNDLMDL